MVTSPSIQYKIDNLCSFSINKTILEVTLNPGLYEKADIEQILKKLSEYASGKEFLIMINCVQGARTTIEGLRRLAGQNAMSYALAKAYVLHTFHQRFMARLYVLLFRPNKPVRIFTDEKKARKWLDDLLIME
ncbi:MAG: hypothetical protein JNL60_05340 [Bacteroidia bacterium]|nr:hypothetical protein [Bacteroidia bacterium]